jgi:hypothetical protein
MQLAAPHGNGDVMEDVVYLVLSVAFFGATFGMAVLFERLRQQK